MDGLLLNRLDLQSIQFLVKHLQGWRGGEERSSYQWLMTLTSALDSKVLSVNVVLHMQFLPYVLKHSTPLNSDPPPQQSPGTPTTLPPCSSSLT